MDRPEAASLDYPASLPGASADPGPTGLETDSASGTRHRFLPSRAVLRNVLTTVIAGCAIVALVRFFDSPSASASQSVNVTAEASGPAPKVGKPVTDFEAQTPDGKTVRLSDFRGRPVWITFWATWCPPCRAENADIQAAYSAHQDSGLVVLAVNLGEDSRTVQDYVKRTGLSFPIAMDPPTQIAATYRIVGIPTHFFVDANGVLMEQRIGGMSRKMMEQKIQQLLARTGGTAAGQ